MVQEEKVILAYASQYKEKYYFNESLGKLPETVKNEVIMCLVFITEEAGGVAELGFYTDGEVYIDSYCEEDDLGYDAISAGLLVREVEREHAELLEKLQLWYQVIQEAGR